MQQYATYNNVITIICFIVIILLFFSLFKKPKDYRIYGYIIKSRLGNIYWSRFSDITEQLSDIMVYDDKNIVKAALTEFLEPKLWQILPIYYNESEIVITTK